MADLLHITYWLRLLGLWVITGSAALGQTNYAVLVGVTDYASKANYTGLVGPKNDALLLHQFLQRRGFKEDNIDLLIEDPVLGTSPTRANILSALDGVLANLRANDFVYFHFSGHGSQQPVQDLDNTDETDSLDEIILPSDTGKWSDRIHSVENVITDDEIAGYVEKVRNKGAFIWVVFDSCHSGTMTRGNIITRKILPQSMGIPVMKKAASRGIPESIKGPLPEAPVQVVENGDSPDKGGYIGFFAAQTNEETPEMAQPAGHADARIFGLFTFQLVKVLATYTDITYKQAAEQVLRNYGSHPWYGSTPLFSGSDMDAPVFASKPRGRVRQWKLNNVNGELQLRAGALHQIGAGAVLAVIANPADTVDNYLGYVEVTKPGELDSFVVPTVLDGSRYPVTVKKIEKLIGSENIPESAYARLITTSFAIKLTLGTLNLSGNLEPSNSTAPTLDATKFKKGNLVISKLMDEGIFPLDIDWVKENNPSDIKMLNTGDAIYLLAESDELPCPYGPCTDANRQRTYIKVDLETSTQDALLSVRAKLRTIARSLNLMRLSNSMDESDLILELMIKRPNGETLPITPAKRPQLYEGDEISLLVANETEQPQDVTVLFLDSSYGVTMLYPGRDQFNRFMPYDEQKILLGTINVDTTGPERLIVIASSAFRTAPSSNFGFLAQDRLHRTRGISDQPDIKALLTQFHNASIGQTDGETGSAITRWANDETTNQGTIRIFQWITAK